MKTLPIILAIVFSINFLYSQSLTQDSDGFSTIILPSTNFNLDIADKKANFNVSTYLRKNNKKLKGTESGWLIGGEIKAGVENDIASIFSEGNVASDAKVNFLFGRKWFEDNDISKNQKYKKLIKERNKILQDINKVQRNYTVFLDSLLKNKEIDQKLYVMVGQYLTITRDETLRKINKKLDCLKRGIQDGTITDRKIMPLSFDKIKNQYKINYKPLLEESNEKTKEINQLAKKIYKYKFKKIFIRSGVNGTAFKYDLGKDSTTVDSRFEKRNFNGWNFEFGYNIQYQDNNFLGLSYKLEYSNNLNDLEEQESTLTTIDNTILDGQFSNSTKVKAFSGEFDRFNVHSFNFDYVFVAPIKNDDSNVFLAVNPYIRHKIYDNSIKLKNNTVLGIALNAFNSQKQKVMAGISIQTNDLFGVHSDDDTVLGERISIGLLAKITFSGIKAEKK